MIVHNQIIDYFKNAFNDVGQTIALTSAIILGALILILILVFLIKKGMLRIIGLIIKIIFYPVILLFRALFGQSKKKPPKEDSSNQGRNI